jgi:P-type E1-E2 ATPase
MIEVRIPDVGVLRLEHLVLDFNGTLAFDGVLLAGVRERIERLSQRLAIHVVTGDTFGIAREQLRGVPCALTLLPMHGQAAAKRDFVEALGAGAVACIGNGNNDRLMLECAALAIAVVQQEGAAAAAVLAADVVAHDILHALDLLDQPLRLVATLRS